MDKRTVFLLLLGGILCSCLLYWHYTGTSTSSNDVADAYKWDSDSDSCDRPDLWSSLSSSKPQPVQPPTAERPKRCEGVTIRPELNCQLRTMSKPPPSNKAYAGCFFSNAFGLPNLASFYLGARASVPPPTTITRMNGLSACLSSKVNTVIQPGLLIVGQNYRFQGTLGSILIELAEPALISGFTLIHPSKCEIPNGYFSSAPKTFTVYGRMAGGGNLANEEALEFGRYTYRDSGPRAQTFPVQSTCVGTELHKSVLVKFEENYGNQNYTSIYKFEVHGLFANKLLERPEARCAECGNTI